MSITASGSARGGNSWSKRAETWLVDTAGLAGPLPAGKLTIRRKQPGQQLTPFRDQTRFPASRVAEMGDRLARAIQDMDAEADLALRLHPTDFGRLDFLPPLDAGVGKTLVLEVVPGSNPALYRYVHSDLKGDRGDAGPPGPVGPPINFVGTLNATGDLPAAASVPVSTAYKIGADIWVRGVVSGAPAWVNMGPLTGSNLMGVRWSGNVIANAVSVLNFTGAGVINVAETSPGVVQVRIEPPAGPGAATAGYAYVENWNEASNTITVAGFGGVSTAQVEVEVNGRTLLNNGTDWGGDTLGADYRVTIPSTQAKNADSVAVRIVSASAGGGGGGGGATIYRQDDAPTGAADGSYWIDSTDENKPYFRVSGNWVLVRDGAIGVLQSDVSTANADIASLKTRATNLETRAGAIEDVNSAQATTLNDHETRIDTLEAQTPGTWTYTEVSNAQCIAFSVSPGVTYKMQSGRLIVAGNTSVTVNFPVPFTTAQFSLGCSYDDGSTSDGDNVVASRLFQNNILNINAFTLHNGQAGSRVVMWTAAGV